MFDLDNLDNNTEVEAITWLKKQDDLYENQGDSEVTDDVYDRVRRWASISYPANVYFTGAGADVRGGKVNLPYSMSGLTQVYEGGDTLSWANKHSTDTTYCISDKLDGTSAMVVYDGSGNLQIAFSRGNTVQGADITRHIKHIHNIPKSIPATGETIAVRMEIEMRISQWTDIQAKFKRSGGETYKNARNAVAGIMNASVNDPDVYNYLNGVAYTRMGSNLSKVHQLEQLKQCGFEVAKYKLVDRIDLQDTNLTNILNNARANSDYELDGIVVDINESHSREQAQNAGIPTTVKYKVADASNYAVTSVKEVVYRASKDAYLKPRVNIHPVQLMGVTVNFATGFNAKFIKDNKIGPGAKIRITRSGDVIPYILNTVEPATPQLPDSKIHGDWHWTENDQGDKVDAVLDSALNNKGVTVLKLKDIFTKLKIPHLKEGSLDKLYDAGFTTFESIVNAEYTDFYLVLGQNGAKIDEAMDEILDGIYWPEFVGSLNIFGRGISRKSMTTLYDSFKGDIDRMRDPALICEVEGFDIKTAQKIADNIDTALELLNNVSDRVKPSTYTTPSAPIGDRMIGQSIVFTGVRSAEVEKAIVEQGGELKSTISSKVTILVCKDVNSNSGKAKKARQLGITVVDLKGMEKLLYS